MHTYCRITVCQSCLFSRLQRAVCHPKRGRVRKRGFRDDRNDTVSISAESLRCRLPLRPPLPRFVVCVGLHSFVQCCSALVLALRVLLAGFPCDVLRRLLVEEASQGHIVKKDRTADEEGIANARRGNFIRLETTDQ